MNCNYQTLPDSPGIFNLGYYIVTWKPNGDYKSHSYYGPREEDVTLEQNQTLELRTGGGWSNKCY